VEDEVMTRTKFNWGDFFLMQAKFLCNILLAAGVGYLWYYGYHATAIGSFTYLVLDALDKIRDEVRK
jgi:hypothetical protein